MFSTSTPDGFVGLHPSCQVNCHVCMSDIASFYDLSESQNVCTECCNDIWYARKMLESIETISGNWPKS